MRLHKFHWIGIIAGVLAMLGSFAFILTNRNLFFFVFGIGLVIGFLPFVVSSILEGRKEREKDEMFLEFSRNLVESVKSGTPISKSIINIQNKNFGSLTPHIKKLANQISMGIPVSHALETFAFETKSPTVIRSITLVREAERAGGNISDILESVAKSVSETENLKKERRSAVYSIVVQGYIIFFVFVAIMLVVEFGLLPQITEISDISTGGEDLGSIPVAGFTGGSALDANQLSISFLALLLTQGFFAGFVIGKLAEGNIKAGIKHSFILIAIALLISTGSKLFLGAPV